MITIPTEVKVEASMDCAALVSKMDRNHKLLQSVVIGETGDRYVNVQWPTAMKNGKLAPERARVEAAAIRTGVSEAGGKSGKVNVSLRWSNSDKLQNDLDLWVITPSEERIGYSNKQAGGGELDVDRGKSLEIGDMVENIVWSSSAPKGRYIVRVNNYKASDRGPKKFMVSVKIGNHAADVYEMESKPTFGQDALDDTSSVFVTEFWVSDSWMPWR